MSDKTKRFRRVPWRTAERLLGGRVDRRKAYYFCRDPKITELLGGGPVFEYGEWTVSCAGCRETEDGHNVGEYPWDDKAKCYIGAGCDECGYTGKRRDGSYFPSTVLKDHAVRACHKQETRKLSKRLKLKNKTS